MNGLSQAALRRAAISFSSAARLLALILGLVLGVNVATAQEVGFIKPNNGPGSVVGETVNEGSSILLKVEVTVAIGATAATVDYVTQLSACAAGVNDATLGEDYPLTSGQLTFNAGAGIGTTRSITVPTLDDAIRENALGGAVAGFECFRVQLFNPTNATLAAGKVGIPIYIKDDEANPAVTVSDATVLEGGSAALQLTLSHKSDSPVTFKTSATANLAFLNGTTENATLEDADYRDGDTATGAGRFPTDMALSSTISALDLASVLYVPTWPDNIHEGDEQFQVQLLAGSGYTIADAIGNVTITDDDAEPVVILVDDKTVAEDVASGDVDFTVRADRPSEKDYTVALQYIDVTANAGSDYTTGPATVMFTGLPVGGVVADATVTVPIIDDQVPETGEIFVVQLVDGAGYSIDDAQATGYITDDDGIDLSIAATKTAVSDNPNQSIVGATGHTYEFTVTNDGAADATDVLVRFKIDGLTWTGQSGCGGSVTATAAGFDCGGSSAVMIAAGASRTYTISADIAGAHGDVASIEALVSDEDASSVETDPSDNEARVLTSIYGVDFGDRLTAGSHVMSDDLILGSLRDAEAAGATALAADADDTTGEADEDGLPAAFRSVIQRGMAGAPFTNYLPVSASDKGFLSVFVEYDDAPGSFTKEVDDLPVKAGLNWVAVDIAQLSGVATGVVSTIRLRLCSAKAVCNSATGALAPGGEIEDYAFTRLTRAQATSFDVPAGTVEPVTVSFTSTDIVLFDGNGVVIFENDHGFIGTAAATDFTVTGNDSPNSFVVDVEDMPAGFDLDILGGAGDDALVLRDGSGATHATVTHTALNASDGDIEISTNLTVRFRNFAPVADNLDATNREFIFSDGIDDNVVLRDNGSDSDGYSFIDSNGSEAITFKNPTTSLKVWAGKGADSIDFQGVDETDGAGNPAGFAISLYGNDVADSVTDLGDVFHILPLENSSSLSFDEIKGGAPAVCLGDVLDVNTSGGAIIDEIDVINSQISFTSGHQLLTFEEIEHFADFVADVKLSLILPPMPATNPGDILPIQLLVENNGPATADCIKINDVLLDGALTITDGPAFTQGSFNSPMWLVGSLAPGASATLSYEVEVGYQFNGEAAITALAPQEDPNLDNNSVTLDIQPAFPFPVKAQATAALWYDHDGDVDTDNRLMVGLANGYAGLTSAVLCRVPNFGGVFSDDLPLWRECGAGLPYPLYVTDLMQVETTDPDDKDLIYLTAWGSDGLYVSTDGGESFSAVNPNVSDTHVAGWTAVYAITEDADGFLYISTNHGFVFRSLNKGVSWQQIGSLPEVDADTPWSLTSHPTEGGRIYAGTFGRGVYTSDDYGFTWEFVGGKAVNDLLIAARGGHAFDLELDPTGDFLFVGTGKGVFRMSLDGVGASTGLWKSLDMEVELSDGSKVTPEVRSLAFDMNGHLYATTWGFGAFRNPAPTLTPSIDFVKIALRGQEIAFVAISTDGSQVAFGSMGGGVELVEALAASATDTESESANIELPDGYALNQNYPNPFNPVTTISFALPETGMARLAVYDILGREVAVLVDGNLQAGQHSMQFDAQGLPTGTYIYRLETDKGAYAKQLVLMK